MLSIESRPAAAPPILLIGVRFKAVGLGPYSTNPIEAPRKVSAQLGIGVTLRHLLAVARAFGGAFSEERHDVCAGAQLSQLQPFQRAPCQPFRVQARG